MAESLLGAYAAELGDAVTVRTIKGSELVGRRYTPLFGYFADTPNAFQVLAADFVSTEDGTGIVHLAPGFGEEDQLVANGAGIPTVCPMDEHGRYTAEVSDWAGTHVFDANPLVIRELKDAWRRRSSRHLRPPVPALLALFAAARVPGDLVVVRQGHRVPRPHGRAQPADHLAAGAHQGRQLRQVARERSRLVDQPQPVLGVTDPGVAVRRSRPIRGSTCTARSPNSKPISA